MRIVDACTKSPLPRVEAELLMAKAQNQSRTWVVAHGTDVLSEEASLRFAPLLERRVHGEPLAYILGEKEFYGRMFTVNKSVLVPRPATEGLVDLALEYWNHPLETERDVDSGTIAISRMLQKDLVPSLVVDVGTGSGNIAVTLAILQSNLRIIATDISNDALEVAKENAKRYDVQDRITFVQGDALEPVNHLKEPFLLVSNPPYVPLDDTVMEEVRNFEPAVAVFGGEKGITMTERLIAQAKEHPFCVGYMLEFQKKQLPLLD